MVPGVESVAKTCVSEGTMMVMTVKTTMDNEMKRHKGKFEAPRAHQRC